MGLIERVLFTTDFSQYSEYALNFALEFAEKYGAELIILHVVSQPTYPVSPEAFVPNYSPEKIAEQLEKEAGEKLDQIIAEKVKDRVACRKIVLTGTPYREIVATAKELGVSLIVMATHGRTGLSYVFMGSVAEKVVRKAACPVLTIKHPDFAIQAM